MDKQIIDFLYCPICNEEFHMRRNRTIHMKKYHNYDNEEIKGLNSKDKQFITYCEYKKSLKTKRKMSQRDENGLTKYEKSAQKAIETMRNDIDKNGLDKIERIRLNKLKNGTYEKSARKMNETKLNTIDENGLNIYEKAALQAHETKINFRDIKGRNKYLISAEKTRNKRRNDIDENGNDSYKRGIQKALKTMEIKDPISGLSGKERKELTRRKTMEQNNKWVPLDNLSEYKLYCREVDRLTSHIADELFKQWDGYDHYDNEYILPNKDLEPTHSDYPTIDHKKSKFYGFHNNVKPEDIAILENLCITKRSINSSKANIEYKEFIERFDN